ncbi:hypothetical protein CMI37_06830 [Candidatus Pacearchaeota archaeon]|nr:hypothetical protein [Candidatus Pacearchaeota archaeon]
MAVKTTRKTLRQEIIKALHTDATDFISSTASSNGTSGTLIDSTLASFRRKPTWFKEKRIFIPGAAAADQVRVLQQMAQDSGTLTPDRDWSSSSVTASGVEYEVFGIVGPDDIHIAINDALKRAEESIWLVLKAISGTVDYNLSLSTQTLIVHSRNKYLPFTEGSAGAAAATITEGIYTGEDLATEIQTQLNSSATDNTYTVTFNEPTASSNANKFTVTRATGSDTFGFLWKTGATYGSDNNDTHIGTLIGFADAANDAGATTYTSDNEITLNTWLQQVRQTGVAREVVAGVRSIREIAQIRPRADAGDVWVYLGDPVVSASTVQISALRAHDILTFDDQETRANAEWIKAGALRYLYVQLAANPSLSSTTNYDKMAQVWQDEWLNQCGIHQGRLVHPFFDLP